MNSQILPISPDSYLQHEIHTKERDWAETNCYVDVWIEQLNALGFEPIAAMAFSLGIDFEGDQWTFFKFQLSDLQFLYDIEVQELAIWQPLIKHIETQVKLGRPVLVELDSMYLPDTAGTAYRTAHVKTTVAINSIDIERKHLGYFHAQGYYELESKDFDNIFKLNGVDEGYLEPYVEIAKLSKHQKIELSETVSRSLSLLKNQIVKMPQTNPFHRFKIQLEEDLNWLSTENIELFHQYSFATLRQFGACFELSSVFFGWLKDNGESELDEIIECYKNISESAKIYQFQLARVVSRGKSINLETIDKMAELWQKAKNQLEQIYTSD